MYIATVWVDDQAPALDAQNLNHIESGITANDAAITNILSGAQVVGKAATATTADSLTVPIVTSPVGAIIMWPSSVIPAGWMECNGAALPRTHALFAVLSTVWGVGDGVTTFNIPDLRGQFIRGWDHGKGVDTGRTFGSSQDDTFKSHTHGHLATTGAYLFDGTYLATATDTDTGSTVNMSSTGDVETRPKNYAMIYLIKSGV